MKLKAHNILLAIFILIPALTWAKDKEAVSSKHYEQNFKINQGDVLKIDGSFASFTLKNWDKSQIGIQGDVSIEARNQEKADRLLENIKVVMNQAGNQVEIQVEMTSGNKTWDSNGSTEMEIDFVINVPEWIQLNAEVSFGELNIARIDGPTSIDLEYGSLVASSLRNNENQIDVSFGSGEISAMGGGSLSNSYGELTVLTMNGDFELNSSYGEASVEEVTSRVTSIDVSNSFGELTIVVPANVTYSVEASSSFGDVDIDGKWKGSKSDSDWESEDKEGTLGTGSATGKIEIKNSFGEVTLSQD